MAGHGHASPGTFVNRLADWTRVAGRPTVFSLLRLQHRRQISPPRLHARTAGNSLVVSGMDAAAARPVVQACTWLPPPPPPPRPTANATRRRRGDDNVTSNGRQRARGSNAPRRTSSAPGHSCQGCRVRRSRADSTHVERHTSHAPHARPMIAHTTPMGTIGRRHTTEGWGRPPSLRWPPSRWPPSCSPSPRGRTRGRVQGPRDGCCW
jgi:hypothetical protein